jgi:hypothetical protein
VTAHISSCYNVQPHMQDDDAVYARSPVTAAEEATQYFPGSRFLNTTEFKRMYLGSGEGVGASNVLRLTSAAAATPRLASSRMSQREDTSNVMSSFPYNVSSSGSNNNNAVSHSSPVCTTGLVPRRPPPTTAQPRSGKRRSAHKLYGAVDGNVNDTGVPPPSTQRACPHSTVHARTGGSLDPNVDPRQDDVVGSAPHLSLSQQLRYRVRAARRSPSAGGATANVARTTGEAAQFFQRASDHGLRTEDAWLSLHRELAEQKAEVQSLRRQLRHAQVLVRTLHGVAGDIDDTADEDDGVEEEATKDGAEGAERKQAGQPSSGKPRPTEYWQRRAYFLEQQQQELTMEVERLRRDARGSKVRALVKELEVVRKELRRYRRCQQPSQKWKSGAVRGAQDALDSDGTPESAPHEKASAVDERREEEDGEAASFGPVAQRWSKQQRGPAGTVSTSSDEYFLRQKDDLIRDLRERLGLLTQQYQKADAQVITSARQLEDLTHRYTAMQAEWRALQPLPQELARVQQQLNTTQAQLLDSDREVEAFHQLFDTLESPATLRAVIEERDHLVELLRQSQRQQAGLRDEMKTTQQQAIRAVEAKYLAEREEEHAMSRDREAQQEETIRKLRKQVELLECQLEAQREAYEAQLEENANAREADLTERLLESITHESGARGRYGAAAALPTPLRSEQSVSVSRSPLPSTSAGSRPPSRDGPRNAAAPRRTPGDDVVAVASVGSLVESSTSELLGTKPSVHESAAALVQHRAASCSPPLSPHVGDVTGSPEAQTTAESPTTAHESSSLDSSWTSTSDATSFTDDTVTDSDAEDQEMQEEKKRSKNSAQGATSSGLAMVASPSGSPSSGESPTNGAAVAPVPQLAMGSIDSGAVAVRQAHASSEDVSGDHDEVESSRRSHSPKSSSNSDEGVQSGSDSSSTQDDGYGLNETIEKAEGSASDSSSGPATPLHGPGVMRIGFGFPKPLEAAIAAPPSGSAAEASTSSSRRGHVFDFPAPPIAIVHPVSILINRNSVDNLKFSSDLRAVVHSPLTSPQQTATATSDLTQSQPTLTASDSDREDEEEEGDSSSYSDSTSASTSASVSAESPSAAPRSATVLVAGQDDGADDAAAHKTTTTNDKGAAVAVPAAAAASTAVAAQSSASTIHSGSQSVLDNSLEPAMQLPITDSPTVARRTQLAASAPARIEAPEAAENLPLACTTEHTPTLHSLLSLHGSLTNSPGAVPNKAAPIPSPPAITPLLNSNLYPPRTSSGAHLEPTLTLEDNGNGVDSAPSRGGTSPQLLSVDHSSFDLAHQFSGNASFDFVGPLAERHRLEDLQNNTVLSQKTSPATLPGNGRVGAIGSAFPSAAPAINPIRSAVGSGDTGLRKTPSPPLMPEARQHSSTILPFGPNVRPLSAGGDGGVVEADTTSTTVERKQEAEEASAVKSVPSSPVLATAASENLVVAASSVSEAATGQSVDGPSQPEAKVLASPPADNEKGEGEGATTPAVELFHPVVPSPSSKSSDVSPSPILKASPQEAVLSSFAMEDTSASKAEADATKEAGADAVGERPPHRSSGASPSLAEKKSPELPTSNTAEEGNATSTVPDSAPASAKAAPPLLPLPPMVQVPTALPSAAGVPSPPPASVSSSPSAKVSLPPSGAVPLPPHATVPQPPSPAVLLSSPLPFSSLHDAGADDAPVTATTAVRAAEGMLSALITSEDAHTLSGVDLAQDEDNNDDNSFSSTPPMVVGGTVEKSQSPPEPHLPTNLSLLAPCRSAPLPS